MYRLRSNLFPREKDAGTRFEYIDIIEDVAPFEGNKGENFLKELNELQDVEHDQIAGERK